MLLLEQQFINEQDGDTFDPDGPGGQPAVTNTNYAATTLGNTTTITRSVADADPRIISNLISDQTAANLAAAIANGGAEAVLSPGLDGVFGTTDDREVFFIPNATPDEGLSAPFNSWFTFFGQFFDHGLDLVDKGGNGTVFIPLMPDDPLIAGADGIFGNSDDLPMAQRFMAISRATNQGVLPGLDGQLGTSDDVHTHNNQTTPFIDQNQTYTSHASHQVYLREYELNGAGDPVSTGRLIDGMVGGGIGNWKEVKAQAADMLGLRMNDADVLDAPWLVTDAYGKFTPGANGFAQVFVKVQIVNSTTGAVISTVPGSFIVEGANTDPDDGLVGRDLHSIEPDEVPGFTPGALGPNEEYRVSTVGTGHAFLNDIAHTAAPVIIGGVLQADVDTITGNPVPVGPQGNNLEYDNELLDAHFITGDGRGNENIGLSSVHFIFHAEHNRMAEHVKDVAVASNDVSFTNQWLLTPINQAQLNAINAITDPVAKAAAIDALNWNGEHIFQAARFGTEMQYQHLVFEEFARKVQPQVDVFLMEGQGYNSTINPAIAAEFAHVVYRFGHSMLTETIDRFDPTFHLIDADPLHPLQDGSGQQIGLIAAFLNPLAFAASGATHAEAAGAIIRGVTRQVGNEIDEFVTEALRNNLVGLPLDLPAINIARGRDTGVPTLNQARAEFFSWTGDSQLKPYTSWADFVQHIKHPESLINFIAAYGTHPLFTTETTLEGKRAAAMAIVTGNSVDVFGPDGPGGAGDRTIDAPADRLDFLNATGDYAPDGNGPNDDSRGGLNNIDLWIGGLAEKQMPFGGLLGSTFNYVFENQMEKLQNGDRFYYLERTAGLNFLTELENNSFAKLIMANTDAKHLPGDVFSAPAWILEVDQTKQFTGIESLQQAIGQSGTVTVTQAAPGQWHTVTFDGPIADAVVVMMVNTSGELTPAVARVRNVTSTGFQFQVDEWEEYNGSHAQETLSWLAMSAGDHVLADGTHIRAGVRAVDNNLASVSFGPAFTGAPVVLTQVSTVNDPSSVTTRLANVTASGFDVRVQEEQLNEVFDPAHGAEQVGWIAIAQAVTGTAAARATDLVGDTAAAVAYGASFLTPVFLAQMQTQLDLDTAAVRGVSFNGTTANVFVQEETSFEPDTTHTPETVGFVALNTGIILPEERIFNADPTEGGSALTPLVIRNNPATPGLDSNYLQYTGVDHVVLGGTANDDIIISSIGDDTLYGDAGDDRLEGGDGVDMILGGAGDDIITDKGGDDNLQGGDGDDAIHAGNGINLILGGFGNDFIVTGEDSNEAFGGGGNDFIFGTRADEMQFGGEGDDWIEHGLADGSAGENFDTRGLDSIIGHDVFIGDTVSDRMLGEGGDDIMLGNGGQINRYVGSSGFDWAAYKNDPMYNNTGLAANVDMNLRAFNEVRVPPSVAAVLDRFESVEGLSGSSFGDVLRGDDLDAAQIAASGFTGSVLTNFGLIAGLREFVAEAGDGLDLTPDTLDDEFHAGNIILGGDGSDLIQGRGGDDLIDGDLALNVRIMPG